MMESSEQPPHSSFDSLESDRSFVASDEDFSSPNIVPLNQNGQVNEEIQRHIDNPILVLSNSKRIPLKGEHVTLAQNSKNEMIVLINNMQAPSIKHAMSQEFSVNSDNKPAPAMQCELNNPGTMSTEGISVIIEDGLQNRADSFHCSSEALLEQEGTRQLVFIPRKTKIVPYNNHSGHYEFTGSIGTVTLKQRDKKEIGSASEEPVIPSQTSIDSYSSKIQDRVGALNEERTYKSLPEEYVASVVETSSPTMEEKLSLSPLDIDLTASVTHKAAPIFDHDWRTNILEDEKQTEESSPSKLALPTKLPNVIYFEFSDLKEFLDSELFSESPFIEESSNHSDMKGGSDFSSKIDNANLTTSTVKKTVDEDNTESIHFPSQLQSSKNINRDSKDSVDFDQSQNLENISYQTSKENEMNYTNSEGACSEIQTGIERTFLSLVDNSKLKSSLYSNSEPKDHNLHLLKKMKPVNPSEVKDIDVYDLQTGSINLEPELSDNSSLDRQCCDPVSPDETVDMSKDIQLVNSNLDGATGNLTYQGILTAFTDNCKLNKNLTDDKSSETYYDNPQYSLDQDPQHKVHSSGKIAESTTPVKFCENNQNSIFSEIDLTSEDKIGNENSLFVKNDASVDSKSQDDTIIGLISDAFDGITVKPPQRTYSRKKKTSYSIGKIEFFCDDFYDNVSNSKQIEEDNLPDEDGYVNIFPTNIKIRKSSIPVDESTISLRPESSDQNLEEIPDFVLDADKSVEESICGLIVDYESKENDGILSNIGTSNKLTVKATPRTYIRKKKSQDLGRNMEFSDIRNCEQPSTPKTFCLDEKEEVMIDGYGSADEDYVNLLPSNIKTRISSTVDESAISLRPESSDQTLDEQAVYLEPEDMVNICHGTYLIDPLFKTACTKKTERDAPSASLPDVSKEASHKKKIQTISFEKNCAKTDKKSSQLLNKVIKSSSIKMKNASFDNTKIRKKIKKTVKNSNFSCSSVAMVRPKIFLQSKDGMKWSKWGSTAKTFGYRFKYNCSKCNFGSNRVNNLIAHLKYNCHQASNLKDYHTDDMRKQRLPHSGSLASSQNFSNGSAIHNRYTVSLPTTSEVYHQMAS